MTKELQNEQTKKTLDRLKEQNIARGKYLVDEEKRLTQVIDYINNALKNPDRAYDERSNLPIYRSGVVTNQLLHSYPDTFCERAVRFTLPEYQRIQPLYHLTTLQRLISHLPLWLDKLPLKIATVPDIHRSREYPRAKNSPRSRRISGGQTATVPDSSAVGSITSLRHTRLRSDSIAEAIRILQIYQHNYDLIAADDERAREFDLPINRLASMIDYIQFLDPTPEAHLNLFRFLKTLALDAKQMNHRQLRLHNSTKRV